VSGGHAEGPRIRVPGRVGYRIVDRALLRVSQNIRAGRAVRLASAAVSATQCPWRSAKGRSAAADEEQEHGAAKDLAQGGAIVGRPARPAHESAVGPETAVGDDEMEMGMPVGQRAVGLLRSDSPVVARTPAVTMRAASRARSAEKGPAVEAVGPEPLGDREDHLAVRDGGEERLVEPEGPAGESLGVAAGAELAAPAGEGEQVLVGAGVAADPGEAVLQDAAGEKPVHNRGDDGAPRAVGMGEPLVVDQAQVPEAAVEQAIERGCARPARPVDPRGLGARRGTNPMLVVCDSRRRHPPAPVSERAGWRQAGQPSAAVRARLSGDVCARTWPCVLTTPAVSKIRRSR